MTSNDSISVEPRPQDVLMGRRKGCYLHPGNIVFRNMCREVLEEFAGVEVSCKRDLGKLVYDRCIQDDVRFLELSTDKKRWLLSERYRAIVKITQDLREWQRKRAKEGCENPKLRRSRKTQGEDAENTGTATSESRHCSSPPGTTTTCQPLASPKKHTSKSPTQIFRPLPRRLSLPAVASGGPEISSPITAAATRPFLAPVTSPVAASPTVLTSSPMSLQPQHQQHQARIRADLLTNILDYQHKQEVSALLQHQRQQRNAAATLVTAPPVVVVPVVPQQPSFKSLLMPSHHHQQQQQQQQQTGTPIAPSGLMQMAAAASALAPEPAIVQSSNATTCGGRLMQTTNATDEARHVLQQQHYVTLSSNNPTSAGPMVVMLPHKLAGAPPTIVWPPQAL